MTRRLHVPLLDPEDVIRHLGKQELHWKSGRSAHALATVWHESNVLPAKVEAVLTGHPDFQSAELVDAFLERKVDLGSEGRPSQTDLLAIVGLDNRLAVVAVEGKAGESFGERVEQWLDNSDGKQKRLDGLCGALALSPAQATSLRYQLLHRAVSALIEAKRYRTDVAVLLVHSFSDDPKGLADFSAFLRAIGFASPVAGALVGPVVLDGVSLYAGWIQDEPPQADSPLAYLDSLRDYAEKLKRDCDRMRAWCDKLQTSD